MIRFCNCFYNRLCIIYFNLHQKYKNVASIKWLGKQSRDEVFKYYQQSDCLIFPSKLETWGLPISEAMQLNKPVLAANLPYAHETANDYKKIYFFEPTNPKDLASVMNKMMDYTLSFNERIFINPHNPFCKNWVSLFNILLN